MSAQWYWLVGEDEFGPFTSEQLQKLARNGQLAREHHVRPEASPTWLAATDIPGLFPADAGKAEGSTRPAPPAPRVPASPPTAPPPAAHVARPVPRAAKVAVAAPAAVPVAVPVTAAAPQAVRAPRPVRASEPDEPPSAVAAPPAWDVASPPVSHARREVTTAIRSKRSQQQMYLIIGLLGTFIVLSGIVTAVLVSGKKPERVPAVAGGPKKSEPEPEKTAKPVKPEDVETDPGDPAKPSKTDAGPEGTRAAAGSGALAAVTKWFQAPTKAALQGKFILEVISAWKTADGKSPTVHVEVQITNLSSTTPLDFRGWSAVPGAATAADLYDDAGGRLARLDKAQPATQRLLPRDLATQALEFALPKGDFKRLRLVLAGAAVGQVTPIGFEISPAIIGDGAPEPLAARPVPVAGKTKKSPLDPDLSDDLKRQIQDDERAPEMDDDGPAPKRTMPDEEAKPQDSPEPKEKPADLKLEIENEDFKE